MRPGIGRPGMDEMMGMMREMMAPMVGVIAYTPGHLLAQKDSLKLTPDQVTKLTNIENSAKAAHETGAADFKTHMGAVSQAFQTAAPDTTALRPHFEAAHAAMGKAHWAMVAAAAQSRAVLTDARSEEHTSELQSRELISYAVFCLKKKKNHTDEGRQGRHPQNIIY